jgi:hypothetical protein
MHLQNISEAFRESSGGGARVFAIVAVKLNAKGVLRLN